MNVRSKGIGGENEFCDWLYRKGLVMSMPQRNLEQVRSGGIDVIPKDHPFAYEVKRVETITDLTLDRWWMKATIDTNRHNKMHTDQRDAIVAYRRNKADWSFLVGVEKLLGLPGSFAILKAVTFIKYAQKRIVGYSHEISS